MTIRLGRRAFIEQGSAAAAALSAASLGLLSTACSSRGTHAGGPSLPGSMLASSWRGAVVQENEGELLISGRRRAPMRIKVDSTVAVGATMSMLVSQVFPGASIPVHLHRKEDELIFIHTGTGIVTLGDERVPVSPGAVLYGARNVWHGVENTGSDVMTWCAVYSPPGLEQYFRKVGVPPGGARTPPTAEQMAALAREYGLVFRDA